MAPSPSAFCDPIPTTLTRSQTEPKAEAERCSSVEPPRTNCDLSEPIRRLAPPARTNPSMCIRSAGAMGDEPLLNSSATLVFETQDQRLSLGVRDVDAVALIG